jgi:hypothetical protein
MLTDKEQKNSSVALPMNEKDKKPGYQLSLELEGVHELPFEMKLMKSCIKNGKLVSEENLFEIKEIWPDYMLNQFAYNMFSERFKEVIEKELTGNEEIDWIAAKIHGNGECKTYYILRFTKKLDTINEEKSLFDKYGLIRPCFSSSKVEKYSIFHVPDKEEYLWKIPSGVYVTEKLKKAIQKAKLTGVGFEKTEMS